MVRRFPPTLEAVLSEAAFDAEPAPSCILDPEGLIVAVNRSWDQFAIANGGAAGICGEHIVGTRWLRWIEGGEPRKLATEALARALHECTEAMVVGARPPSRCYRAYCDAPTLHRLVEARFATLDDGPQPCQVLVTYSTILERRRGEELDHYALDSLRDAEGFLHQCSGCRRVLDPRTGRYLSLGGVIEHVPERVTHGMCSLCLDLWYGSGTWRALRDRVAHAPGPR